MIVIDTRTAFISPLRDTADFRRPAVFDCLLPVRLREILTYRIVDVSRENLGAYHRLYVGFNAVEALAWFTFAVIVLLRWRRNRKTQLEIVYSLLFVLFGLSDVMETIAYPLWLLLAKAVILAGLLLTRRHLIRFHYIGKKF